MKSYSKFSVPDYRGLFKSFLIYYGIPFRKRRLSSFYSQFISPGDLAFDIGAHIGNRIRAFRSIGARCIALEPQPSCLKVLEILYKKDPNVVIEEKAIGERAGTSRLFLSRKHPSLSTLSRQWIESIQNEKSYSPIQWDDEIEVETVTLDMLIEKYGMPRFCKIDVEGFELEALKGLSKAIPALSVEFLPADIDIAIASVDYLSTLSSYEFNISMVEKMKLVFPNWIPVKDVKDYLASLPSNGRSGDVYARLERS